MDKFFRVIQEYEGYIRFSYVKASSIQEAEQMGWRCADSIDAIEITKEQYNNHLNTQL